MTYSPELDIDLYRDLWDEPARHRWRESVMASVLFHVAAIFGLILYIKAFPPARNTAQARPDHHVTLLFPTPKVLTQKEPNRAPPSKLFVGAPQPARPPLLIVPRALPSTPPPPKPKGDEVAEEKPPQLVPKPDPSGSTLLAQLAPPPVPAAPKIMLEEVPSTPGGRRGDLQPGVFLPQKPGGVIEGAVRDLSRNPGPGGTIVGDGAGGGVPGGFTHPGPGSIGSNLELMSDPMGVDFKPYLTRILAAVRRNWYAVIPESARLGMVRGRVAIQFMIIRTGSVAKLVISSSSGMEALDRAAVAGISASNPFPPLPTEFRGDNVKLQFTFLYNIPIKQ